MGVECAWIIKKVRSIDVSKDIEFQKQFTYFYRVRRNEDSDVKKVDFLIWGSCHSPPFPILRRRTPLILPKQPAEIKRVIISNDPGDFIHGIVRGFQQHLGVCDTDGCDKLHGGSSCVSFEVPDKPADTHSF